MGRSRAPSSGAALWQDVVKETTRPLVVTRAAAPLFPVVYANAAFEEMSGYPLRRLIGRPPWFLDSERLGEEVVRKVVDAFGGEEAKVPRARGHREDGSLCSFDLTVRPLANEKGQVTHFVVIHEPRDATFERPVYNSARGPSPRTLFSKRLAQLTNHVDDGVITAVLVMALDRHEALFDTFGHGALDRLVDTVANRIADQLRGNDMVARVGDSKLAIALCDLGSVNDIIKLAQRLLLVFNDPFEVESREVFATASIGVAAHPLDSQDPETLLSRAEIALRRAQDRGGNTCNFFTLNLQRNAMKRLEVEMGLRRAIDRNELALVYQPQMDIATGDLSGVEALIRWNRPDGQVAPATFIPVAEESDLIVHIGEWVLRTACAQMRAWCDMDLAPRRVSVNLSARQFRHPTLFQMITDVLAETGLHPSQLELELTESTLMGGESETLGPLKRLKALGVRLSIDDFGTGYSSLSYLKRFPIDALKIDRAFVKAITEDRRDREITRTIITMAHALDLRAVAEGVEEAEQLSTLRELGCDEIQGYLIGRPMQPRDLEPHLMAENEDSFTRRKSGVGREKQSHDKNGSGTGECA